MAVIDLEKFTFVGDTLKGVGELSFEFMKNERNALTFVSTFGNIKVEKEIGFLTEAGLVGKKDSGCDPQPHDFGVGTRKVKWAPEDFEVLVHLCYKDLAGTIAEYELKSGVKKPDFTESDYMAITEMVLARALNSFLWRTLWFGDKDASNVTDGGVITDGVDVDYFNLINGYWKQIFAQCTINPKQKVAISANAGASYSAQVITPADAKATLDKMYYSAPMALRNLSGRVMLVTQSLYDAYEQYLTDMATMPIESVKSMYFDGVNVLKCHGVEVIAMPEWDENITAYEDNGTTYNKPNRGLYTSVKVLGAGFENENNFDELNVWYDKDSRKVKMEAMGNIDAELLAPDLFVASY